jgi:hypothetical protein
VIGGSRAARKVTRAPASCGVADGHGGGGGISPGQCGTGEEGGGGGFDGGVPVAEEANWRLRKTLVRSCGLGKKREGLGASEIRQTLEGSGAHCVRVAVVALRRTPSDGRRLR